jgi:bacteriocin-like protein
LKENETVNKLQSAPANELNENELENVSGGLGGITLIDLCQGRFNPAICLDAIGEKCPRLVIENKGSSTGIISQFIYHYVVSCNKGCFNSVDYSNEKPGSPYR